MEDSNEEFDVGNIPFSKQLDDFSCVAHCIKMVLNFFTNKENHTVPDLSVNNIIKIIKTTRELATNLEDIKEINKELVKANPILKFYPDINYSWEHILNDLREKRPIITWIRETPDPFERAHSIVIKKYEPNTLRIIYLDPLHEGEQTFYIGEFLKLWNNAYNILIPISVGEVLQTKLNDVIKKGEDK